MRVEQSPLVRPSYEFDPLPKREVVQELMRQTVTSEEAEWVLRYHAFVYEGSKLWLEGDLKSHSLGTILRGTELMEREDDLREQLGIHPLALDGRLQELLFIFHDMGEMGAVDAQGKRHDILFGMKTDYDRKLERHRFEASAAQLGDADLYATLLRTLFLSEQHQLTVAGRFWKKVCLTLKSTNDC